MADTTQSEVFTAQLGVPEVLAYGIVRGAGNQVLLHENSDKSRIVFHLLGKGEWDSILNLWVNKGGVDPASPNVHFHRGTDGLLGSGLAATSTGGDQKVDAFYSQLPIDSGSYCTFSGIAYIALYVPPDPGAPSADLEFIGDFKARRIRSFDALGNQTGYGWSDNLAWIILDVLVQRHFRPDILIGAQLPAATKGRIDFASFADSAAYCGQILSPTGAPRFSGGVAFAQQQSCAQAIEQLLDMCQGYILEDAGKIYLRIDRPRAFSFTLTSRHVIPGTLKLDEESLRGQGNHFLGNFNDTTVVDNAPRTRFTPRQKVVDHEAHQDAVGIMGAGLARIPKQVQVDFDFGNNTAERVHRLLNFYKTRNLGIDIQPYRGPKEFHIECFPESVDDASNILLAQMPGDVISMDASVDPDFAGLYEILQVVVPPIAQPDSSSETSQSPPSLSLYLKEYIDSAFSDTVEDQVGLSGGNAPTGLPSGFSVDIDGDIHANGRTYGRNTVSNPGFESLAFGVPANTPITGGVNAPVAIDWSIVADSSLFEVRIEDAGGQHGGARNLLLRLKTGVVVPSDGVEKTEAVTGPRFRVYPGDLFLIGGFAVWAHTGSLPAGVTARQRILVQFYDKNDALIPGVGVTAQVLSSSIPFGYNFQVVFGQVPTGAVWGRVQCANSITNGSGAGFNTGSLLYADMRFDDILMASQIDPSSGDLSSKGSVNPTWSGKIGITFTDTTADFWFDGTHGSENAPIYRNDRTTAAIAGSKHISVTGLTASTPYFVYFFVRESTLQIAAYTGGGHGASAIGAICLLAKSNPAAQEQGARDNIPLSSGAISFTTLPTGGTGGSGGGGGSDCVRHGMKAMVRGIGVRDVKDVHVGEQLLSENPATREECWTTVVRSETAAVLEILRIEQVDGEAIEITPGEPMTLLRRELERAELISIRDVLRRRKGRRGYLKRVEVLAPDSARVQRITCSPFPCFYVGEKEPDTLIHNMNIGK